MNRPAELLTLCLAVGAYCPTVMAIPGQTAECSLDGMSITLDVPAADADFIYAAPCTSTTAVCLTEAEFIDVLAIPSQYRKCVDNDADPEWDAIEEMTPAEKDIIDAPANAAAAEQAAYTLEVSTNNWCAATLQNINDRVDTYRDNWVLTHQAGFSSGNTSAKVTYIEDVLIPSIGDLIATAAKKSNRCVQARAGRGGL